MDHYVGVDGGGSKTECVVMDAGGRVVARAFSGPSNPLRIGLDQAVAALNASAAAALASAGLSTDQVRAVCAGLAGAGRPNTQQEVAALLKRNFPKSFVHVTTDLEVALEAAAGAGSGVVLIAGTGSCAYGRNAAGEAARAGGYGRWISDVGSAFDIGRRALAALASARDRGERLSPLAERILSALGISDWNELVERVARDPDDVFPRLFPLVVEAADASDAVARKILASAAAQLADLAATVIRRLRLKGAELTLAKSGGVFGRSQVLDTALNKALLRLVPQVRVSLLDVSPAVGAARLAKRLVGLQLGSATHGAKG